MPLKLNVGVSRKIGMPDYGSVGASCNLEMELDAGLLEKDPDDFHARIRRAYVAAHQAVHDELARLQASSDARGLVSSRAHTSTSTMNGNTRASGNGRSARTQSDRIQAPRAATPGQVRAIQAIARRRNADLPALLSQEFDTERPEDLTLRQASGLIDRLKSAVEA